MRRRLLRHIFARLRVGGHLASVASPPPAGTAPTITSPSSFDSAEAQTSIGTIVATGSGTMVYSITGGADQSLMAINAASGALTWQAARDFEAANSAASSNAYAVQVQAAGDTAPAATQDVTVNLTNVAEVVPIVTASQSFSIAENASNGAAVGTVLVTPGDSTVDAFEITGGNTGAAFAINGAGVVTKIAALDYSTLASYTLAVRAQNVAGWSASVNVAVSVLEASAFTWSNIVVTAKPTLTTPLVINSQALLDPYLQSYSELPPGAASPIFPTGNIYYIDAAGQDVLFDARTFTVTRPVKVLNAGSVHMLGKFVPALDAAGAPGLCSTQDNSGGLLTYRNIYPRPVGGSAIQVSVSSTVFFEGLHLDMGGQNGDAIIVNGASGVSAAAAQAGLDIYLVNSRIEGFVGHVSNYSDGGPGGAPLGDSPHADAIQFQSEELSFRNYVVENVSIMSGQEGVVGTPYGAWANSFRARNVLAYPDFNHVDPDQTHWSYIAPIGMNARYVQITEFYAFQSQVYNPNISGVGVGENHWLYWSTNASPAKIMYFTAGNGSTWGNCGDAPSGDPVADDALLDMLTWEPTPTPPNTTPYNPNSYTSVVSHNGLHTIPGTIAAENMSIPTDKDFAPAAEVGLTYVSPFA